MTMRKIIFVLFILLFPFCVTNSSAQSWLGGLIKGAMGVSQLPRISTKQKTGKLVNGKGKSYKAVPMNEVSEEETSSSTSNKSSLGFKLEPISSNNNAVLTVVGEGATLQEAEQNALRSAIAQAYGVFVSANTTLLNDSLVKDEIATVTSGNIKSYNLISSLDLPQGRKQVTMKVVVAVNNLINYAKARGASVEFSGAAFVWNMKLRQLNKENELKAVRAMWQKQEALIPYFYKPNLIVETPSLNVTHKHWSSGELSYYYCDNDKRYKTAEDNMLKRLNQWDNQQNVYEMTLVIQYQDNGNFMERATNQFLETFKSLSLSDEEAAEYEKAGLPVTVYRPFESMEILTPNFYFLRNSKEDLEPFEYDYLVSYLNNFTKFVIKDNTGQTSEIFCTDAFGKRHESENIKKYNHLVLDEGKYYLFEGTGIFYPFVRLSFDTYKDYDSIILKFPIQEKDLYKYTSFEVVRK